MPTPKQRLPSAAGLGGVGDHRTAEIMRQLSQLFKIGKVVKNDPKKGTYDLDFGDNKPKKLKGRIGRAGDDVEDDMHTEGEQVLVLNLGGDLGQGIIIGALHKDGQKLFDKDTQKGRKYKDGTLTKHDTEKKQRTTTMKKGGTHAVSVDKQKQTVDDKGTRLENDKATVHVKPDGTIVKANNSASIVIQAGGNTYINC